MDTHGQHRHEHTRACFQQSRIVTLVPTGPRRCPHCYPVSVALVHEYDPSRAGVGDRDRGRAGGDGGQNTAVLLHVDDGRARGGGRAARRASRHTSEGDGAPVGEGDEASALREVLDDPLRVLLAERGLAGERVRDRLPGGVVDDRRRPAGARRRGHGHGDRVSGADRDAREVVRKVGEPLEPG